MVWKMKLRWSIALYAFARYGLILFFAVFIYGNLKVDNLSVSPYSDFGQFLLTLSPSMSFSIGLLPLVNLLPTRECTSFVRFLGVLQVLITLGIQGEPCFFEPPCLRLN